MDLDLEAIRAWLGVLDDLTYYVLLGVPRDANADDIKLAFHVFADTFHPDSHAGRLEDEREAIGRIFRRGTEAYRVLADPTLRAQYDASLDEGVPPSIASRRSSLPPARERAPGPKRLEDALRSPNARPVARRAEELAKGGDFKQAKIQLTMARHYEPNNPALEEFLKDARGEDSRGRRDGGHRVDDAFHATRRFVRPMGLVGAHSSRARPRPMSPLSIDVLPRPPLPWWARSRSLPIRPLRRRTSSRRGPATGGTSTLTRPAPSPTPPLLSTSSPPSRALRSRRPRRWALRGASSSAGTRTSRCLVDPIRLFRGVVSVRRCVSHARLFRPPKLLHRAQYRRELHRLEGLWNRR